MPDLRVRLMGPFQVASGDVVRLPVGKATTVAQLLVVRRGTFVSTDTVSEVLWGEDPPPAGATPGWMLRPSPLVSPGRG